MFILAYSFVKMLAVPLKERRKASLAFLRSILYGNSAGSYDLIVYS